MNEIADITLRAEVDAPPGAAVSFADLFPWRDYDEVRKVFEVRRDVTRGMPLDVHIEGVGTLAVRADMDKRVGERPLIGPWMLLSMTDLRTPLVVESGVRAGQELKVIVRQRDETSTP